MYLRFYTIIYLEKIKEYLQKCFYTNKIYNKSYSKRAYITVKIFQVFLALTLIIKHSS